MAKYFRYFPSSLYSLENRPTSTDLVTNIMTRFKFDDSLKEDMSSFYQYAIQEGESPEMIAHKLYGNVEDHWIILLFNNIVDPYFDWPMRQNVLNKYIEQKYLPNVTDGSTGVKWAANNIKSYYITETRTNASTGTKIVEKRETDVETYTNINPSKDDIILDTGETITLEVTKSYTTYLQYEIDLNETKRTINLIKPELVGLIKKEFKKVIA